MTARGFDVLIVGAGSAGCVVANRLSADPACRVGLLEAGGVEADPDIADPLKWPALWGRPYDRDYTTLPQPHTAGRVHRWARGRLVGGSSALNAMAHVWGHAEDFAEWGAGWSFADLKPGFETSSAMMAVRTAGIDEVSPVTRAYMAAGEALGLPRLPHHNLGPMIGVTPNSLTMRDGRRVTSADAYLDSAALARPNFTLLTGHIVERLAIRNGRFSALEVRHGNERREVTADRIVLCLGAIDTPLLLMRSGIGDEAWLARAGIGCLIHRREIGRNLQDHLLLLGNIYAARQPVPPSRLQHSESLTYMKASGFSDHAGQPDIVVACVVAPSAAEGLPAPPYGSAFTLLAGACHPTSRGEVRPSGPTLDDPPAIEPRYLSTAHDRRRMREALIAARTLGHHAALDGWRQAELQPGTDAKDAAALDDFVARAASTHHHPLGTCRMGADADSIVDLSLGLRGIDGVSIVDASVMPRIPSGPIQAALLALAETWCARLTSARRSKVA